MMAQKLMMDTDEQYRSAVFVRDKEPGRWKVAACSRDEWRQWCAQDGFSEATENDGFNQMEWARRYSAASRHFTHLVLREEGYSRVYRFKGE